MITVDELKKRFGAIEDQDLGPIFGRKKGAVSVWRKTGVPANIERMAATLLAKRLLEESDSPSHLDTGAKTADRSIEACRIVEIFNMVEGGPGAEPEWHEPIDKRSIPTGFLKPHVRAVLVRGRSMEPTFKHGAIIGIDKNDRQVIEGEAYAIVLPYSGAAVKRIYPLPDGVLIRSDNKEFPEVKLKKEEIPDYFILGRVCWVVQEV